MLPHEMNQRHDVSLHEARTEMARGKPPNVLKHITIACQSPVMVQ